MTQIPLLAGLALGISLAAPPGPIIALMAYVTPREGAWAGTRVGLGAMTADALYLLLAALGAAALLATHPALVGFLAIFGAALMLFFAYGAFKAGRHGLHAEEDRPKRRVRSNFTAGFLIALTSPYNLAWWAGSGLPLVSILGPMVLVGFFAGLLLTIGGYVGLFAWGGKKVPGFASAVAYASAALLAGFAAYFAYIGWQRIAGGG